MIARGVNMIFNTNKSLQEPTIAIYDDAYMLPAIPEILHSTGDVVILTALLTHCVLTKDIYLQAVIRMPAWIFLTIVCSKSFRLRDERCAILQELLRLGVIMYYGLKLNLFKFPRILRLRKESVAICNGEFLTSREKQRLLSQEELDRFYKGVPTLAKGNESVAYDTLPYDKTLEVSRNHFVPNNNQRCIVGHNGVSFQGVLNYSSRKIRVCIKTNVHGDLESLRGLMKEAKLLKFVGQHDNLQNIFGAYTKDISLGKMHLVLENCGERPLGDHLRDLQKSENPFVPEKSLSEDLLVDFYRWAYEISSGMKFISSKGVVHGMLTCDCILLNEVGTIKLTDYGTAPYLTNARRFEPEKWEHDGWKYFAPEAIIKNSFTTSGDVWSFGIVLWKIFTISSDPYPSFQEYSKIFSLSLLDGMRPEAQSRIPSYIFNLLEKCWLPDPEQRPTFDTCCQYTYMKTKAKRRIVTCDGDFIT